MKRVIALAALLSFTSAVPAAADVSGKGWISPQKVTQMLAKKGYRVTKIEADDGHWEGEAMRKGARYDFHVDPRSGQVTKMERDRD